MIPSDQRKQGNDGRQGVTLVFPSFFFSLKPIALNATIIENRVQNVFASELLRSDMSDSKLSSKVGAQVQKLLKLFDIILGRNHLIPNFTNGYKALEWTFSSIERSKEIKCSHVVFCVNLVPRAFCRVVFCVNLVPFVAKGWFCVGMRNCIIWLCVYRPLSAICNKEFFV